MVAKRHPESMYGAKVKEDVMSLQERI